MPAAVDIFSLIIIVVCDLPVYHAVFELTTGQEIEELSVYVVRIRIKAIFAAEFSIQDLVYIDYGLCSTLWVR